MGKVRIRKPKTDRQISLLATSERHVQTSGDTIRSPLFTSANDPSHNSSRNSLSASQKPESNLDLAPRVKSKASLLQLQRTHGNAFVQRFVQCKLSVSQPGDEYEQQADRVADAVVRVTGTEPSSSAEQKGLAAGATVQRMCPECEEEMQAQAVPEETKEGEELNRQAVPEEEMEGEEKLSRQAKPGEEIEEEGLVNRQPEQKEEHEHLQMKMALGEKGDVSADMEADLRSADGNGQPLPRAVRAFFEPRMGYDFSQVKIHTDGHSARLARSVNALAFTKGRNIVFGAGQYRPETTEGKRLLAHELTHVVQQRGAGNRLVNPQGVRSLGSYPGKRSNADGLSISGSVTRLDGSSAFRLQRACARGTWNYEYDGCSLPGFVQNTLGIADKDNPAGGADTHFGTVGRYGGRPCDNHDRCYQTCGSNRAACDFGMFRGMRAVCRSSSASSGIRDACFRWARTYYAGLVAGGAPAHTQRQGQSCACAVEGTARRTWGRVRKWLPF